MAPTRAAQRAPQPALALAVLLRSPACKSGSFAGALGRLTARVRRRSGSVAARVAQRELRGALRVAVEIVELAGAHRTAAVVVRACPPARRARARRAPDPRARVAEDARRRRRARSTVLHHTRAAGLARRRRRAVGRSRAARVLRSGGRHGGRRRRRRAPSEGGEHHGDGDGSHDGAAWRNRRATPKPVAARAHRRHRHGRGVAGGTPPGVIPRSHLHRRWVRRQCVDGSVARPSEQNAMPSAKRSRRRMGRGAVRSSRRRR